MQVRIAKNLPRFWLRPEKIFGHIGLVLLQVSESNIKEKDF